MRAARQAINYPGRTRVFLPSGDGAGCGCLMTKVSIHTSVGDHLAFIRPGMVFLLLMLLMQVSHLDAAPPISQVERMGGTGAPVLLAAIDGEATGGATDQEWASVVKEHKSGLLAGGAVLGSIILFSALILVFMVRRTRQLHGTPGAEATRRGGSFIPSMREAKVLSKVRGSKAFPVTPEGKPARSGDTTRLTLEEELAAVEDETPGDAPIPPLRTPLEAGIWAVITAWICLVAGLGLMVWSPGSFAACAPLFLIAVLLAVTAMAQRLVLQGSLVLAALYLAVPAVWLTQYLGSEEDIAGAPHYAVEASQTSAPNPTSDPVADAKNLDAQREALLKAKPGTSGTSTPPLQTGAPPAVWKQVIPANKTTSASQNQTTQGQNLPPIPPAEADESPLPAMRVPGLPPAPPRKAGALFSYRARLSHADHLDQNGVDLRKSPQTTFGDLLLQERLHVHQLKKRDPEDTVDTEFATLPLAAYRALFIGKEVKLPKNVLLFQLLGDDIIVDVQVFREFLDVQMVSVRE